MGIYLNKIEALITKSSKPKKFLKVKKDKTTIKSKEALGEESPVEDASKDPQFSSFPELKRLSKVIKSLEPVLKDLEDKTERKKLLDKDALYIVMTALFIDLKIVEKKDRQKFARLLKRFLKVI